MQAREKPTNAKTHHNIIVREHFILAMRYLETF